MNNSRKLLVLLLPKYSYRNEAFMEAAQALNAEVVAVQNRCRKLAETWEGDSLLSLPFDKPEEMAEKILSDYGDRKIDAVLGVDDVATVAAQKLAQLFSISTNGQTSAEQLTNKYQLRLIQKKLKLPAPEVFLVDSQIEISQLQEISYPAVIKPTSLSASQGVIRADVLEELTNGIKTIENIFNSENVPKEKQQILIEQYLPGEEYALEGLMKQGELEVLAVFEKPEPLEGPYFEETLYISPSNLLEPLRGEFISQVAKICDHAGWNDGPVHAEARINKDDVFMLEVAPRTIGGRCSRSLFYQLGMSLEELVLRHSLGESVEPVRADSAIGVCMLPVPHAGIFDAVKGVDRALNLVAIKEVLVTAVKGDSMVPLPEGNQYIGFIIAQAENSEAVKLALIEARNCLDIRLKPLLELKAFGTTAN